MDPGFVKMSDLSSVISVDTRQDNGNSDSSDEDSEVEDSKSEDSKSEDKFYDSDDEENLDENVINETKIVNQARSSGGSEARSSGGSVNSTEISSSSKTSSSSFASTSNSTLPSSEIIQSKLTTNGILIEKSSDDIRKSESNEFSSNKVINLTSGVKTVSTDSLDFKHLPVEKENSDQTNPFDLTKISYDFSSVIPIYTTELTNTLDMNKPWEDVESSHSDKSQNMDFERKINQRDKKNKNSSSRENSQRGKIKLSESVLKEIRASSSRRRSNHTKANNANSQNKPKTTECNKLLPDIFESSTERGGFLNWLFG